MSAVVYGDCPACGKAKNLSKDDPKEIVNCPACGVGNYAEWWLNLRTTPQRVDPRGWFGRLPDTMTPTPDPPPHEDRRRIEQLEEMLFDAEQELEAAASIIDRQDREIADLKFLLDLEEAARRKLERRLAEAEDAASRATRPATPPVLKEPAPAPPRGYPPGYRPNPVVEAMIAAARASGKR